MPLAVIITASIPKTGQWLVAITLTRKFQRVMEAKHGARDVTTNWRRKVLLESAEEDKRFGEMQVLKKYILNRCCCGCEHNASHSEHVCLH